MDELDLIILVFLTSGTLVQVSVGSNIDDATVDVHVANNRFDPSDVC